MADSERRRSIYSSAGLLDIHERSQRSLSLLMAHCRELSEDELNRELPGFGYPSVHLQLHHVIGAERYWLGVLNGIMDADDDAANFPTIQSLEALRKDVASKTASYLREASEGELNSDRSMTTWGDQERVLNPASVIMRTQTHGFHHQGQVAAMCRLLGKPTPGSDYAVE